MPFTRPTSVLVAALVAVALAACAPATSDGGAIVQEPNARIDQVLAARAVLAEPVPKVTAEAERLVAALEELWVVPVDGERRSAVVGSLRTEPYAAAVAELDTVELEGDGPDIAAARAAVATMLDDAQALEAEVALEHEVLGALAAFDERLQALPERWDEPGQYSEQLAAFEQLALDAAALADDAATRTGTPACTEAWDRREAAARTVAERTDELRLLVRDRRGQEFDELRDEHRQDPFGLGARLTDLDAEAAAACWAQESQVPALLASLLAAQDDVAAALDPADL